MTAVQRGPREKRGCAGIEVFYSPQGVGAYGPEGYLVAGSRDDIAAMIDVEGSHDFRNLKIAGPIGLQARRRPA